MLTFTCCPCRWCALSKHQLSDPNVTGCTIFHCNIRWEAWNNPKKSILAGANVFVLSFASKFMSFSASCWFVFSLLPLIAERKEKVCEMRAYTFNEIKLRWRNERMIRATRNNNNKNAHTHNTRKHITPEMKSNNLDKYKMTWVIATTLWSKTKNGRLMTIIMKPFRKTFKIFKFSFFFDNE